MDADVNADARGSTIALRELCSGELMSHLVTKPTKWHVRPAKTQISLGTRPVWSESLLCAQWVAKEPNFLHADNEDSDQTGRMSRLIWVFAGLTATLLVLSRGDSNLLLMFLKLCIQFGNATTRTKTNLILIDVTFFRLLHCTLLMLTSPSVTAPDTYNSNHKPMY